MYSGFQNISFILFTCIAILASPSHLLSQQPGSALIVATAAELPEAPQPQLELASEDELTQHPATNPNPTQSPDAQGSSILQTGTQQSDSKKSQYQKAEEQIKEQEKQRTLGVVPAFNVSYRKEPSP